MNSLVSDTDKNDITIINRLIGEGGKAINIAKKRFFSKTLTRVYTWYILKKRS